MREKLSVFRHARNSVSVRYGDFMLEFISHFLIFGRPFIMYLGILVLTSFLFTASISVLNRRGITVIPFKWHPRFAAISISLAIIHGTLGIAQYL